MLLNNMQKCCMLDNLLRTKQRWTGITVHARDRHREGGLQGQRLQECEHDRDKPLARDHRELRAMHSDARRATTVIGNSLDGPGGRASCRVSGHNMQPLVK